MGFKKENYTRMGIAMSVFMGIFLCISIPELKANTDNPPGSCLISVLEEPRPTSRRKGTRHVESTKNNYRSAEWAGLNNGRILDDEYISATIIPNSSSSSLTFNNFNFKIPAHSEVSGMDLYVDGKAVGDSTINVETTKFYILDEAGNKLGNNLNEAISFGNDWNEDGETHMWKYNINAANWGDMFTSDLVNSTEFGILMEVRNHGEETVEVLIDRVNIEVHYKPTLTLCNEATHLCFPFLGPRDADILGYNWTLSGDFNELEDNDPKVYNLLLDKGADPGIYEICVEVTYASGTEQCCRHFEIVDCTPSSVGDMVWEDINGNGLQDDGEPGVDGVGIDLFDDTDRLIASTTTEGGGNYTFDNIDRGCYYMKVQNLNGYLPSIGPDNFLDGSNGYGTTDYFTLESDTSLTHLDLGLVQPASIAGTIWHDVNANGTDDQEPTLSSVSLSLNGPQGTVSTTTDDSGNYRFDNLVPGDYDISVSTPNRYELTVTGAGDETNSSDFNQEGLVSVDGIVSGDEVVDIDGGFFKRGTIGDYVWYDFNVNGIQDDNESGIEGVEVRLVNADGIVSRSTTDDTGRYSLTKVKPGNYHLAFTIGDDYLISIPNAGDSDDNDSDVETLQDQMRTSDFEFSSCDSLSNIDAGFIFKPGSIAGTIWSDDNRDHQRQPDESRQISTTVSLYNSSDVEMASETVQSDGSYLFGDLQPGNFYVKFDAIEDHIFANADSGSEDSDSDVTSADAGTSDSIEITPDLQVMNVDAGYIYLVSSISGVVWEDENRDHKRSSDENAFGGIEVNLYFGSGELAQSTTTDNSGNYRFDELRRNEYYITFGGVDHYLFVTPNAGDQSESSSVTESVTAGSTDMISLAADTDLTDINSGYIEEVGTILGNAWEDLDIDGTNNDQTPFENIEVTLFDNSNQELRSTSTAADGNYSFELVPVGEYYTHFELPTDFIYAEAEAGSDESNDSDVTGASGEGTTGIVSIEQQDDVSELDGGYVINQGRVTGFVWKDNDEDGQRQSNEAAMESIEITLYDNTGTQVETTSSDAGGEYAFEEITAGDYHIKVDIPDDNIFTPADQGDDATDSDITEANGEGTSDNIEVLTGRRTTTVDAGGVDNFGNILGVAWCDVNEDGILETNEELIEGINVSLVSEAGQDISATVTAQGGAYAFFEVPAGTYYLVFEDEDDKDFTLPNVGDDDLVNSSVNSSLTNGSSFVFRVGTGNKDYIKNAGYQYLPGSISGQAWIDDNGNRANDDGAGFDGISVTLYDVSNNEIETTTTSGDGTYGFDDVYRGDYYVVFSSAEDYLMLTASDSDDSKITNGTTEGGTNIFNVAPNQETSGIDGGYELATGSVSGQAWIDDNDNDTNDDGNGFEGIEVTITSATGERTSTTTSSDGSYLIEDVLQGTYEITFEQRGDYDFVAPNVGDEDKDSDITGANGAGTTDPFEITPRNETMNVDGGYVLGKGSIAGTAWIDDNDDAINNDNNGQSGIEVTLLNSRGEGVSTTTSDDGSYLFEDVFPGTYTLSFADLDGHDFVDANVGDDDTTDSDVTGSNGEGSTDEIVVGPRENKTNVDAGYMQLFGSISGKAWIDDNDNGINDEDIAYEGIDVTLFDEDESLQSTTTNADGYYSFDNVTPGSYTVSFAGADGYDFVEPNQGEENQDSDVTNENGNTDPVEVTASQTTENVDAGYVFLTGSICGLVWSDDNTGDGLFSEADQVQDQYGVSLENANEEIVMETTTDLDGGYCFLNVSPGEYRVVFNTIDGQEFVAPNQGTDQSIDSDVTDRDGGKTEFFNVQGRDELFYNAGIQTIPIVKGSISGKVWKDNNDNDVYDDGDDRVDGLGITLLSERGMILNSTNSASDGTYSFGDLDDGAYILFFENRDGQEFVQSGVGDNRSIDSDVVSTLDTLSNSGVTDVINIVDGQMVVDIDAGVYMEMIELGSVSGTAWRDSDNDGINDDDESGLAGIEVRLFNNSGEELANSSTDDQGNYSFGDLNDGSYYVVFEDRDSYEYVAADQGDDDSVDSDVTGSNGNGSTDPFEISGGSDVENVDAGYYTEAELYSISGRAFLDANNNNVDDGEDGFSGIQVFLVDSLDVELAITTTGDDGSYSFENLESNAYVVVFGQPDGEEFVSANEGDDDSIDSDVEFVQDGFGATNIIFLTGDVMDVDAGFKVEEIQLLGSICGSAFRDDNKNDINDDDSQIGDVEVVLYQEDGTEVAVENTDDSGNYCFTDLDDGRYYVVFRSVENYDYVAANVGDDNGIDSDVTGAFEDGSTDVITIEAANNIENVDAGYFTDEDLYSICGKTWFDINGDGIRTDDEPAQEGIMVFVVDSLDTQTAQTVSDVDGNYCFDNLEKGTYAVVFIIEDGFSPVIGNNGDDDSIDSDPIFFDGQTVATDVIFLDENKANVDAGMNILISNDSASISGRAWRDVNENHINDDNTPYAGIEVQLLNEDEEVLQTTTTDVDGNYSFNELEDGTYTIRFEVKENNKFSDFDSGDDDSIDSDVYTETGLVELITLTEGVHARDVDAGYISDLEFYSICGKVFIDVNGNGIREGIDEGLTDVSVFVIDSLGTETAATTTDSLGNYCFDNLEQGQYVVAFRLIQRFTPTISNVGDDDTIDSDAVFFQDDIITTDTITLDQNLTNIDAGMVTTLEGKYGDIRGRAWQDVNENHINDDNTPFEGIEVYLLNEEGESIDTTTTDIDGNYAFIQIDLDSYFIRFETKENTSFSDANVGDDDTIDSDVTTEDGRTDLIVLVVEGDEKIADAGYITNEMTAGATIRGRAWRDINENSINDDDAPYPGIVVNLQDAFNEVIETTTTDIDGNYEFTGLNGAIYYVEFELKADDEFAELNVGDDDSIDSDVRDNGITEPITLDENGTVENVDAGYISDVEFYSISGKTWIDINEDHINNDDAPFSGIQVFLVDSLDAQAATATTDSLGNYSFSNVPAGTYGVVFTLPPDYRFSDPNVGDDESIDSDVLLSQNNLGAAEKINLSGDLTNIDAGYIAEESSGLSIAGNTFIDSDENGIDDDSNPLPGITVVLFDTTGVEITRTSSDDMGAYSFMDIDTGAYYVSFWLDSTYVFTDANIGDDDTIDSDVTNVEDGSGSTEVFDLMMSIADLDAGYISTDTTMTATGSLSGIVWEDTDPNGIRADDEPGVVNVEVILINDAGEQVASTTTDDDGNYSFNDVEVGDYTVRFVAGDDQTFVIGDAGDDDTVDSDVIQADGSTTTYTITENETVQNVDAGILTELPQASLCGNVWIDSNEDGIHADDEDKVIGVLINIFNENGEFVDSTRTTTGGFYSFTDLLGGYYYLMFDTEGDYYFTTPNAGDDDGFDSDVTEENGDGTTDVFLGTGKIKLDAGLIPETGSYISGKVWGDTDANNAYNEGDLLIEGQEVFLVNRVARVIATTTTGADGTYRFDLTESGEYAVFFATNDSLQFVTADASGDEETDSDVVDVIMLNGTFGTTNLIDFNMGQRIRNVDAGYVMTMEREESITGIVWMDGNDDATRQEDEQGLAGVEVRLYNSNDELIATTTTGADGTYVFMDLGGDDYYIEFVKTSGEFVEADAGEDDSVDSDVEDLENGRTMTFTFESGTPMSFDAGISGEVEVNTICGTVWNDSDQNNLRVSEAGRADHVVYLLAGGEIIDTTMTGSDGTYAFANLEAGTYSIQVEAVEGYGFSEQNAGDDDTIDSDVNASGLSDELEVSGKVTVDAGVYFSVVGLSGKVWGDTNEDNIYNEGDVLIEGHTVYLVNQTARVLATTTTAADGTYSFSGLSSGTYAVFFDYVEGEEFVSPNASDDESIDSDVLDIITQIGPYGFTDLLEYEENTSRGNIDAGIIRTPSTTGFVAGVVWIDSEEDGIRQDDEDLFSGIEVKLFTTDGTEVATMTTDDNGAYEFDNVNPGFYYVEFVLNGREFVEANLGDDERVDSDVENLSSGRSGNFEVEVDMTAKIDAGVKPAQSGISGTVWFDFNEDGRLDGDEDGVPDNEVKLYDSNNDEVAKTNTDANGEYSFSDIEAGDYYIEVFLGGAFEFTDAKIGDDNGDSDITEANGDGTSDTFTFNNGLLKVDAGQISVIPSFISGQVWKDNNGDHILDDNDEGIGSYNVYLQFDGAIIDTAITEPDGTYIFENLPVGEYFVLFEMPDGQFFVLPNIPEQENKDSDVLGTVEVDGVTYGVTESISIGSGQVKVNVDAGITDTEQNPGSIAGRIWLDENENNFRDDDENPIEGVTVTLYDDNGTTVAMQEIGESGTYKFENLVPDTYGVQFTIPSEYNFVEADQGDEDRDSDVAMFDGTLGVAFVEVADGVDVENIDAGLKIKTVSLSSIGDIVWLDLDEDGILDDDELGMNEVNVELFNALTGEMIGSMVTTDHPEKREPGYYSFDNLQDGEYYLRFNLPGGYIFSNPKMGTQEIKDSDVTGANGTGTTNIIKVEKIQMTDIDVGAIKTNKAVIGDFVFNDRNENGVQDLGEDGINNIRVRLFDTDNQQVAQAFTMYNRAMDRAGYFSFKVDPGTYFLRFDISQGLSFTDPHVGGDEERDSDVTGENGFGTTAMFEVELAETKLGMDAGLITEPANLGDRLWVDENSDGIFNPNEEGINGVEVSLYDKDSNLMISTTTQSIDGRKGSYLFENISAGQYYVGFDLPDDYVATTPNIGGNDAEDSDITNVFGKGTTSLFTLSSGEDELDIDGGIVLGSSIGDYAWDDNDGDGIQDSNEPGREGVFVKLLDTDGNLIDTTSTDQNGAYLFDGLVMGEYRIDFDIPADRAMTTQDAGSDDDEDSDPAEDGMTGVITVGYNEDVDNVDAGFVSNSVAFNSGVENELIAKVFPNPTLRFITLETSNIYQDDTSVKEVSIFDNQGTLVKSFNEPKLLKSGGEKIYELDLDGVVPGVYYLRAKVGKLTYNKKLILINN